MPIDAERGGRVVVDLSRVVKLLRAVNLSVPSYDEAVEPTAHPLLFAIHDGPARVTDLAARIHTDVSVVSRQVSQLESRGLITKVPDPDDGRASLVTLTSAGAELISRVLDSSGEWMAGLLRDWTPDQADTFISDLRRLADSLHTELCSLTSAEESR
ncbi:MULTISPECIES: MarR family transcriptional regulator [unclassified Dietzia]|uniref:MarR family winged helix-turn-helix transcriptional regulator n=1 Tax=unclassified Dietzia TaxID=2617939 RepID=UPI0013CF4770|nr:MULTISPECIES: MarR family transcriptional regulator [unclassified Dietzia]UVE95125.1 MarR family transcriptional regulator [Dietzia sp. B32]